MEIFTKTYDNGLRLILEKNNKDVVAANILIYVGSNNEHSDEEGFAHFIEHMVFKSSKNYQTAEIMDKLTFLGADFNAYTSKNVTRFVFKCLSENFEECFKIYSDMLLHSLFLNEELDKERNVVVEEMKKYEDDPAEVMFQRVIKNYFDGTMLAHDVLGNEENIMGVSRERLLEFKDRFYRAENAVISVAGNIDFEVLDKIVQKYFAGEFDYTAAPVPPNFDKVRPNISKVYDTISRDDSQANICVHIKGVDYKSKEKYVSDLYTCILGNSQNSRLYKKIREDLGLVYTIVASNEIGPRNGEIYIMFGTRPKNVKRAMMEVKKIIREFAEIGASAEELERAKNWKMSCVEFGSETNSDLAEANGTFLLFEGGHIEKQLRKKRYEEVSLEKINEFAKTIANETTFNVVGVGKNLKIEDLMQF